MEIAYAELKEAALDNYNSLYLKYNYSIEHTFYALLGDFEIHESYTLAEKCSLYVGYILVLIKAGKSFDFMKDDFLKLTQDRNMEMYKKELGDEFLDFSNDIQIIKELL